jgi:hypothetical protein
MFSPSQLTKFDTAADFVLLSLLSFISLALFFTLPAAETDEDTTVDFLFLLVVGLGREADSTVAVAVVATMLLSKLT